MLAVELFDTSTDEDININKELIKAGYAWPDAVEKNEEEEERKKTWNVSLKLKSHHKKTWDVSVKLNSHHKKVWDVSLKP